MSGTDVHALLAEAGLGDKSARVDDRLARLQWGSAFVVVGTMPGWLQGFAKYQPLSIAIDASRSLMLGGVYSNTGKVIASLLWSAGIVAVFAPLAVRRYRRAA